MTTAIVWFRRDLRLHDNPALDWACRHHRAVIPLYIHDDAGEGDWPPGAASRWWLHHSLDALNKSLVEQGSRLITVRGRSVNVLAAMARATGAAAVCWNRRYEPAAARTDRDVESVLGEKTGVETRHFNGAALFEPWELVHDGDQPYRVFTPYWECMQRRWRPLAGQRPPARIPAPEKWPGSLNLDSLSLLPTAGWDAGLHKVWLPGERGARRRLDAFVRDDADTYSRRRDLPAAPATSRLSPHLHFGEISPRQVALALAAEGGLPAGEARMRFLRELAWREFSMHLLWHFPETPAQPLNPRFADFPWRSDYQADLRRWQTGRTGVPLVDAGMRELWHAGWMHNRARMVVASFLTKNLLIPWQEGARWFWDTLVDADLANNTLGWQWTAGCGADAAPYFRVFNPVLQGEKLDPAGEYVRTWLPELRALPDKYVHAPWRAPAGVLKAAGVGLGRDYPSPVVDLKQSRERALAAYRQIKGG